MGAFSQEKALAGTFSVIVKTNRLFAALIDMDWYAGPGATAAKRQLYFVMDGGGGGGRAALRFFVSGAQRPAASQHTAKRWKL